jgi:hypothetical protein
MASHVKMNGREREFYNAASLYGLRLESQAECCNGQYRVDFVARTPDGRRVPIELNHSCRGSRFRNRQIRDEFCMRLIDVEYARFSTDPVATILKLKEHIRRL